MENRKRLLDTLTCHTIVFTVMLLLTPYANNGQTPTPNVKVVNTASQPVPVTGSIKVANGTSEPIPVTGTVNVANLTSAPLPVSGAVTVSNPVVVSGTVNVGNTVSFKPVIPDGAFNFASVGNAFLRMPGPINYAITSMTAFNSGSELSTVQLFGTAATSNIPCEQGVIQASGPIANVQPGQTIHLTFPQPFIVHVGGPISCLVRTGDNIQLMLVGYTF